VQLLADCKAFHRNFNIATEIPKSRRKELTIFLARQKYDRGSGRTLQTQFWAIFLDHSLRSSMVFSLNVSSYGSIT